MDKRPRSNWQTLREDPDSKRARAHPQDVDTFGDEVEAEYYIEQRLVGWIIGKAGSALKEIEASHGVKVSVDQSTKSAGYSKVKVTGPATNVQLAAEHMNTSLARANGDSGEDVVGPFLLDAPPEAEANPLHGGADLGVEEMNIEQRYVGWLVGRGGGVIREIEQASGCKLSINQETRARGYSRLQIHGSLEQRDHARSLIDASLERASPTGPLGGGGSPTSVIGAPPRSGAVTSGQPMFTLRPGGSSAGGSPGSSPVGSSRASIAPGVSITIGGPGKGGNSPREDSMQIEQKWVGWLLGKGGGLCKEIEQDTGCRIKIDQSTRDQGFSTVRLDGYGSQVVMAKQRILEKLSQVGSAPLSGSTGETNMQVQVEQRWVGWLLGKSGVVLKEMEQASGAKISIDQATKDSGYSVATISGHEPQIESGFALMYDKIAQVDPAAANNGLVQLTGPPVGESPKAAAPPGTLVAAKAKGPVIIRSQLVELQIDQKWIGWLLGSGGKTVKQMEIETGCKIVCDQSTKELGYSTVEVSGPGGTVQAALDKIQSSLAMADRNEQGSEHVPSYNGAEAEAESLTIEQRKVGWLLGKGGVVLREIESQSGTRCSLDQSTKELGFSTVKIAGHPDGIMIARQMIEDKIAQADGL